MTTRQFSDYHAAHKKSYTPGNSPYYEGTFLNALSKENERRG